MNPITFLSYQLPIKLTELQKRSKNPMFSERMGENQPEESPKSKQFVPHQKFDLLAIILLNALVSNFNLLNFWQVFDLISIG
jgi:hypothetical protein